MRKIWIPLLLCVVSLLCFAACGGEESAPNTLTLTYKADGVIFAEQTYQSTDKVKEITEIPTKDGCVFAGWYYDNGVWEQPIDITELNRVFYTGSYTLHARFETVNFVLNADGKSYTVTGPISQSFAGELSIPSTFLGKKVTHIASSAFRNMDGITALTLGENIVSIGQYAFAECDGITAVRIPNSVKTMENGVFYHCVNLQEVSLSAFLNEIAGVTFEGCTALRSLTLPRSVTSINGAAFKGCTALGAIVLPDNLNKIGTGAFEGCTGIGSITVPARVTEIGDAAFRGCTSLSAMSFASGSRLVSFGANVLAQTAVQTLVLPESVTVIKERAFSSSALQAITFGGELLSIGASAFEGVAETAVLQYRGTCEAFLAIPMLAENWSEGRRAPIVCEDGSIEASSESTAE